jgi:hypothetical protein
MHKPPVTQITRAGQVKSLHPSRSSPTGIYLKIVLLISGSQDQPPGKEPLTTEQQAHFERIYQKRKAAKTALANSGHKDLKIRAEIELESLPAADLCVGFMARRIQKI